MFNFFRNWFYTKKTDDYKKTNKSKLPETYEEAINFVCDQIQEDTVSNPCFHFSGGMQIRNTLGLWQKDSPLSKHMLNRFGLCHADDTGALISKAADAKKNNKKYDPCEDVDRFKAHWIAYGLNPATMEKLCVEEYPLKFMNEISLPVKTKNEVFLLEVSKDENDNWKIKRLDP